MANQRTGNAGNNDGAGDNRHPEQHRDEAGVGERGGQREESAFDNPPRVTEPTPPEERRGGR
jgi:hypothetical protein